MAADDIAIAAAASSAREVFFITISASCIVVVVGDTPFAFDQNAQELRRYARRGIKQSQIGRTVASTPQQVDVALGDPTAVRKEERATEAALDPVRGEVSLLDQNFQSTPILNTSTSLSPEVRTVLGTSIP
jgi:hypothetical protein